MVCPKAAYQGRQANAYKHGNDKNTFFHPYSPYSGYHFTGKNAILSSRKQRRHLKWNSSKLADLSPKNGKSRI
jgi:hypothetical protein